MASHDRCPRCGYVLRYNTFNFYCDFCRLRGPRSISNIISSVEKDLKERIHHFIQTQSYPNYGHSNTQLQSCMFCGFTYPSGNQACSQCGKTQTKLTAFEEQVLQYVSSHGGTISLSQAASDLSASVEPVSQAIERLKVMGILTQS